MSGFDRAVQIGLGVAVGITVFAPSPALLAGSVWGLLAPLGLLMTAVLALLATRQYSPVELEPWRVLDRWLIAAALGGGLLVASSFNEPDADSFSRALGRFLATIAIVAIARLQRRSGSTLIATAFVWAAVAGALVAVLAAGTSTSILGEPLRPTRTFLVPVAVPKTTGMPRSFGEAGLIFSSAIAFLPMIRPAMLRLPMAAVLLAGIVVGQSRNMILTLAVVIGLTLVGRTVPRQTWLAPIAGLAALISPVLVSLIVGRSDLVQENLVGGPVYARNVQDRLSLFDQVLEVGSVTNPWFHFFGVDRDLWLTTIGVNPHNHFVSLSVQDGWAGLVAIAVWYVAPMVAAARVPRALLNPYVQSMVVALVALSFYEGSFSASVSIIVGLMIGVVSRHPDDDGDPAIRIDVAGDQIERDSVPPPERDPVNVGG